MDSGKLIIGLTDEKLRLLKLIPGDIKRVAYYLLALCHIALESNLNEASLNEDDSDYQDFNCFISREILEPTLDLFLERLKTIKEMHLKFQS